MSPYRETVFVTCVYRIEISTSAGWQRINDIVYEDKLSADGMSTALMMFTWMTGRMTQTRVTYGPIEPTDVLSSLAKLLGNQSL